jgi:hypothetical protein
LSIMASIKAGFEILEEEKLLAQFFLTDQVK